MVEAAAVVVAETKPFMPVNHALIEGLKNDPDVKNNMKYAKPSACIGARLLCLSGPEKQFVAWFFSHAATKTQNPRTESGL